MTVVSENVPVISPAALSNNFNFENILSDNDDGHAYIPNHDKNLPLDVALNASDAENNLSNGNSNSSLD